MAIAILERVVAYIAAKIRRRIYQWRIKRAIEYWEHVFEEILGYPDQDP